MRVAVAVVAALLFVASAASVIALGAPTRNGLPAYTDGYTSWVKLNRRPVTTPGAHNGVKNVYASKTRGRSRLFPNGTVIVKSIAAPGAKGLAQQVAVMRKARGRWQWVEYELDRGRYGVLAQGSICTSCHMQARANDWVFTKR
ncbi:MAG TPA: cytochrome P460 family protein [Gaiella sp.]|jgi:hypothetical protein|nr:cytochrome P460 family protein [Gaiella sp.]